MDVTSYVTGNGTFSFALTSASSNVLGLASRESGANAPQLVIETSGSPTPTPTATSTPAPTVVGGLGVERYWTYQQFRVSDRVTLSVNLFNGNLVTQYNEWAIPSLGLTLPLNHTFNSSANLASAAGFNWTHTLGYRLVDNGSNVLLYDGDGSQLSFTNPTNGVYTSPAGVFDILTKLGDGTFQLTHKDQSRHLFTLQVGTTWLPTAIQDRLGNTINFSYDGSNRLIGASAGGGRQTVTLVYDTNGKLSTATNNANQTFTYQYTGDDLTTITDPLNYTTTFAYANHRVTSITDPRTTQTTIAYDANNRVQTITTAGV